MKNMKRSLMAIAALVATGSMASLMQPGVPAREDAPLRLTVGATTDMVNHPEWLAGDRKGFGLESLGGGLGFSHNVGYGFEYGLAASFGAKSSFGGYKLFNKASNDAKRNGMDLNFELMLRYMPEVADGFNMGIYTTLGFSHLFGIKDEAYKTAAKAISFGDLNFTAGLGFSYRFTDMFAMYISPGFQLSNIRIWDDKELTKQIPDEATRKENKEMFSNWIGLVVPVGAKIDFTEGVGLNLEYTAKFNKLNGLDKFHKDAKATDFLTHGVTAALVLEI